MSGPPLTIRLLHVWLRFARPLTLGVRVAAFTRDGGVCLVRHTYVKGWHLPGGGVEPGEDCALAARRELREEMGVAHEGPLELRSIHHNRRVSLRDHVLLYVARDVDEPRKLPPDREIAERGVFPLSALPAETTKATRARLLEILAGHPPSPHW